MWGSGQGNLRVARRLVTMAAMYDFESVSVSSYEAASLSATLAEKSADGWDVVAIVPAGSDVVAYLRRSATTDQATDDAATPVTDGTSNTIAVAESVNDTAAADLLTPTTTSTPATTSTPTSSAPATTSADITTPTASPSSTESGGTGWGAAADSAAAAGGWTSGSETADSTSTSSSWGGSSQQATTPSTPAVPAGWYADPAGRFELRYWDGSAWTEHVSRQGQQYTDPPVA